MGTVEFINIKGERFALIHESKLERLSNANKEIQNIYDAKRVLNLLSYSEVEISKNVYKEIKKNKEIIVRELADKWNYTNTHVAGTLRKLEFGGIIERYNKGRMGLVVELKNKEFFNLLDKIA